jgi:multidrug resistance efflux pump
VAEVLVSEGDHVRAGQVLVRFEAPELEAIREQWQARLSAAEMTLAKARAGLRDEEKRAAEAAAQSAKARWKKMEEGFRTEERQRAEAEVVAARADREYSVKEFRRTEQLLKSGVGKKDEFDVAKANLDRAEARLSAAIANQNMMDTGMRKVEIDEARWEHERLRALADLAEKGTRSEDIAIAQYTVLETQARLREIEAQLAERNIVAPEPVRVEIVGVRKGDLVPPNQPVIRVLRSEDVWVKIYVPETELGKIRTQSKVELSVDSYPNKRFEGEVFQISSLSEFTPRNVQSADQRKHQVFGVKIRVKDSEGVFKAGMAVMAHVPWAPAP